jgi:CDP-glycerol glycerophosphotransferase (TagB/SpsB family)
MTESMWSIVNIVINKFVNKFFKLRPVRFCFQYLFNALTSIVKPDLNLVLFGAMNGKWYGDNSRHLYEWIICHRPDLKPVWMTSNIMVYRDLILQKKPTALLWGGGFIYLLRARVGCFTNSLRDISVDPFVIHKQLNLIALRHGRSVKRIRFARLHHKISDKEAAERCRESELIRFAVSTSEFISDIQEECLKIGRNKHVVTGYPRNDHLLCPPEEDRKLWDEFLDELQPQKVVLYAPSWRHGRNHTRFFPFDDFDKGDLVSFLESRNILLLLRPHVAELSHLSLKVFLESLSGSSKFIRFSSHEVFPDVNTILPFVDFLISDYSALFHDYLLLDRPLLFVPYDYEEFSKKNGFLYDYYENLPGPEITNYSYLCKKLDELLCGEDLYKNKRRCLLDKIHAYQDDKSSERVTSLIDRIRKDSIIY